MKRRDLSYSLLSCLHQNVKNRRYLVLVHENHLKMMSLLVKVCQFKMFLDEESHTSYAWREVDVKRRQFRISLQKRKHLHLVGKHKQREIYQKEHKVNHVRENRFLIYCIVLVSLTRAVGTRTGPVSTVVGRRRAPATEIEPRMWQTLSGTTVKLWSSVCTHLYL